MNLLYHASHETQYYFRKIYLGKFLFFISKKYKFNLNKFIKLELLNHAVNWQQYRER
jgi:hypothetical protein